MVSSTDTVDLIIKSSTEFYNDLKADDNGRYRSWEHCYSHFIEARGSKEVDYDYLSLQLAFYLASWGMYRGSSFLLQKDYKVHIPVVKEQELKNQLSFTLITKILMGTLGCVPAYDRYFIAGIRNQKVATGNYNLKSILQLVDFYDKNADKFECVRGKMEVAGMPYPQMKMLDMAFWQVGFELNINKGINTAH